MTVPNNLSQLLAIEINGLERFCVLLSEEQKALTGAPAERLSDIAGEKAALASRLSQLESARDSWLVSHGHTAGRAGMDALLASRPSSDPELLQWRKLLELAGRAKADNETNGKLIALLLRHNQDALAALLSNGGGVHLWAGRTAPQYCRRPLLWRRLIWITPESVLPPWYPAFWTRW